MAERVGRDLPGGYGAIFCSPAKRAAETVAWFLRGLGQQLPHVHAVVDGLGAGGDDEAGARTVRELLTQVPEDGRGLAVGHTPLIENAVAALTGQTIAPLRECEGVVLEEDDGQVRLGAEYRL